jgi:hypothetical protein
MTTKIIRDRDKQVAYFEGLGNKELHDWTKKYLLTRDSGPLDIYDRDSRTEPLVDLFREAGEDFQQRYRGVVTGLLNDWSDEPLDYLSHLVVLTGRIRATGAYGWLLESVKSGKFKGTVADRMDLHQTMLRVIWGQGINEEARTIFERDKQDKRYAVLCSNALARPEG